MRNEALVDAVLADWRTAPLADHLRAACAFLEKLTQDPAAVGAPDIEPLRASGLSEEAIEDLIQICANLSIINRVSHALGFDTGSPESYARYAGLLLRMGYH